MKILTKGKLYTIELRIDEISETLDLCHETFDADVIENLEMELDAIMETLEKSYETSLEFVSV